MNVYNQETNMLRKHIIIKLVSVLFTISIVASVTSCRKKDIVRNEPIANVPGYVKMLEDPKRAESQKPDEVVNALDIKPGSVIADIGAGSGYFSFRLAQKVGPDGKVLAVDIEPKMLEYIKMKASEQDIYNISTILGAPDDPLLEAHSIDMAFFCNTLHHIQLPYTYLDNLKRAMKPSARLVIIDYRYEKFDHGPPKKIRLKRKKVIYMMEGMGFKLLKEYEFLPYQYFLVFVNEQKY